MSAAFEAAAVGHRITHEGDLAPPLQVTAPAQMGQVLAGQSTNPAVGGTLGQQLTGVGQAGPPMVVEGTPEECPDPCGTIPEGSRDTFIGAQRAPAALLTDELVVPCQHHPDGPIVTGAATVHVNRMPLARRTDQLDCGAFIGEGEPTVLVGGPPTGSPASPTPTLSEGTASALVGYGGASTTPSLNAAVGQMLGEATGGASSTLPANAALGAVVGQAVASDNIASMIVQAW